MLRFSKTRMIGFTLAIGAMTLAAQATTTTLSASADADFGSASISLNGLSATSGGDNAVLDYPITSIPTNATISTIQFNYDDTGFLNGSPDLTSVSVYGRTGPITVADSTAPVTADATFIGDLLGSNFIGLNPPAMAILQSLLGTGNDLGVRLDAVSNPSSVALDSLEQIPAFAPTLTVTYSVPEPTSLAILSLFSLSFLRRRANRH